MCASIPCEAHCRRNMIDDAINIRGLKRYAVDHAGVVPSPCAPPTGKKVATAAAQRPELTGADGPQGDPEEPTSGRHVALRTLPGTCWMRRSPPSSGIEAPPA